MKRILMVAALVAVSALVFGPTMRGKASQKGDDEQTVRKIIDELSAAVGRNDVDALNRIYADGYTFVSEAGVMTTKAQRLAAMKSGTLKYESVVFDEVNVRVYGDTAVATYRVTTKGQANGQDVSGQFRATITFAKMKGRWQEVAAQITRIAGQ